MVFDPTTTIADKFSALLAGKGLLPLCATAIDTLQVNLGYCCNLTCKHCHVQAGPHRTEQMAQEDIETILHVLDQSPIQTLDLTGGAPELHPQFRFLVMAARAIGCHVMVRTNLAVFFEPGQKDLPDFFNENGVEVIASLPCFLGPNVNSVRGEGVFDKCIQALRLLNDYGYGDPGGSRQVHLVHNPAGAFLPPPQEALERQYRDTLLDNHAVRFNRLFTFANMPLGRFERFLINSGSYDTYLSTLQSTFNQAAIDGIMCRRQVNVGWDGTLFDCDFNATIGIPVLNAYPSHIRTFDYATLSQRQIALCEHCFGCTAGQGFTCTGAIDGGQPA